MRKNILNKKSSAFIALATCFMLTSNITFAGPEVVTPGIGNFDAGVIDQINLRQIKDYEQRVRDDRIQEHQEEF